MEDKTTWLRRELPIVAALVDDFASAFGRENIRVNYASENGHEVGRRAPQHPETTVPLTDIYLAPKNAPAAHGASRKGK